MHETIEIIPLSVAIARDIESTIFSMQNDEARSRFFRDFRPINIDKVPGKRRTLNEDAYSPRVVSIGPLHYERLHSKFIVYKNKCLYRYKQVSGFNVDSIASLAVEHGDRSRHDHYRDGAANTISNQVFAEMIMKDSIFMVELFLDNKFSPEEQIFTNPWINRDILHDLILHENQIPCCRCDLHEFFSVRSDVKHLHELIHNYFQDVGNMVTFAPKDCQYDHLLDLLREYHFPRLESIEEGKGKVRCKFSAKQLQEAGVKFVKANRAGMPLLDIKFSGENGNLEIPQLIVNEWSETFYLNVIAFERANPQIRHYACSYFIFMESLVKTDKDVDVLVDHQIIENSLGDQEQVRSLFTNLCKDFPRNGDFYLSSHCNDLNTYSRDWWHQWKGAWYGWKQMLRRDYFSNPWSTISVVAAVILLILTVIQTVCSVISL
ncbi:hypothetical protein LguiA_033129 [Lonicera macranthoides]